MRSGLIVTGLVMALAAGIGAALWQPMTSDEDTDASSAYILMDGDLDQAEAGAESSSAAPAIPSVPDVPPEADEEPAPPTPPTQASPTTDRRRSESTFGQARGFRDALQQLGLTREECTELETALDGVLDFRRCRPEDRIIIERNSRGMISLFEYHGNAVEYVRVRRQGNDRLHGRLVRRPTTTRQLRIGGVVRTSLGDALRHAGLARQVVGEFIEAFDGRINFTSDTRAGDTFRIIVDEERLDGRLLRYGTVHALEYQGQRTGTKRSFWYSPRDRTAEFHDEEGRPIYGRWLRTPCRYDRISSPFNPRRMHPILNRVMPHLGVDYAAATGTTVWAAAGGTVTWAAERGANGNLVSIEHADGYSTHYAHLNRISSGIRRGVEVTQRQTIGQVGSTGRSTGPHLHFGLKLRNRFVDPLPEINGPGRPMPQPDLRRYLRHIRELGRTLERISTSSAAPD